MRIRYLVLFFASILLNWQAFAQTPQLRNPVLEYATGTWCQYCPCGHQVIHDQVLPAVPNTICIAYHGPSTSTDPYKDFTGNAIIDALGFNSYPTGIPDRTSLPIDRGQWKATIAARNTLPAPIALAITKNYTAATRVLNISVKATPQASLNGFYLLNVLILENGLVASQTGNVSYGCIGGTNYVHDHVVRAIINSSYAGDTLKNGAWTSSQPVTRTYQYTLPAGYVPENCEIVALAYKNDIALNTSEIQQGVLASVTPVPIAIVSPNGGETFYIGQSKNIMWRTENIQNVKIEYTTNNGTSWSTIVASTPAEQGYYTWTVPSTASTTCKVRISDAANGTVIKESNSTFSISVMPASAWSIIPTSTTGDIWGIDYVDANIVWICANNGDVRRSTDGGQTFLNAGNVGQGAYTIAAINATTAVCALGPSSGAGKITRTTDGGTTWTTVYAPANNWFDFVEKIDANNLWALSDPISPDTKFHIVKSSDGGATWVLANNAPTQPNSNVYGANNSFYHIGNTFWFGVGGASGTTGANIVYRSTTGVDGPWTAYTTTAQFSGALAFSTQTGAGLCGFWQQTNLLNASPDGGLTWSAVNGTFGQVHGVEFLRGLPIAYAATTTGLWRSLDNGQTWVQDQLPPGTAEMEFVKFYSQTVGMVGGQGGILLRFNGDVAGVTVASPNGGENWQGNTTHNITWSSFNLDVVKIEYTTNNGTNWISIVSGISANQGTYSWVVPNTPGTQCKVRITGMNNTSATDMSDAVFTISPAGPTITWACPIIVKDAASPAQQATVTFGFSPDATNGMDAALGELPLPPLPPTGVFDTRFELPITPADYSLKDYRPDSCKSAVWTLKFQASADPVSLNWNSALLPAGSFILRDAVSGGQIVNIDMKSQSACVMPNPAVTVLTITYSLQTNATIILNSGWNLVSVPIAANSMSASSVFSVGNAPVYGYNNNYFRASSLENGKGYFVRTTQVNNVQVSGQAIPLRKIPVSAGWNMIGTYDYAINTATLGSTPSNIIASVFFGYDGGFQQVTSLQGGKGYWVKTSMAGTLDIPSGLEKNIGSTPIAQIDKGWGKIIITDAQNHSTTLYVSTASLKNPALYELPPVPPAGIFDARFGDGSFASTINSSVDLCLNSAAYPVVIRSEGIALQVIDKATNGTAVRAMVASGKSITITDQNISVLSISNGVEVRMFELQQNYPNPFNPSTTIRYSIPEKATVQLVVYNQLGQKVANLVNEEKAAGQYEATWNASNMPSGVYFYELQAGQFKATKKLILMK